MSGAGLPPGVNDEEWANIQSQIEAKQHKVTQSDRPGSLYRVDCPSQRFSAHIGDEDLVIVPKGRNKPAWELSLRLTAWGAAHDLQPVHPGAAFAESNRVEIRRGPLTEWYVNTAMGLEQGFTIEVPPGNDTDELVLELTIDTNLTVESVESGSGVIFRNEGSNKVLAYSALRAWDAVEAPLEARMELVGGGTMLRIMVEVNGAAWPVTVGPSFTLVEKLLSTPELNASGANFGNRISIDGDRMIVGDREHEVGVASGAVHVFKREQGYPETWAHMARITASNALPWGEFGRAVSISGDTAIVGMPHDDTQGEDSGSIFIYQENHGGPAAWGLVTKIMPADGSNGDLFGYSVSISADTAIVGAHQDDDNGTSSGSAYIFQRDHNGPDSWGQIAKIVAADGSAAANFAASVSLDDDTAICGAPGDDAVGTSSGSAYIFQRDQNGPNEWGQISKLVPSDPAETDRFGTTVAINIDTAIVGAPKDDENGTDSGSVYVFGRHHGGTNAWAETAKIIPADGYQWERFGARISIFEDTIAVGVPNDEVNGSLSGSVYVFQREHGGSDAWGQIAKQVPLDVTPGDNLGASVAIFGDTIVSGAPYANRGFQDSGTVYVFERNQGGANAWEQLTEVPCPPIYLASLDRFGKSVAVSNGTVIVGSPLDEVDDIEVGTVHVYQRDPGRLNSWGLVTRLIGPSTSDFLQFGRSVSISNDTAVVGAPANYTNGTFPGSAFVYQRDHGGSNTWDQIAVLDPGESEAGDLFGCSISIDGDTAVVGSSGDDDGGPSSGSAYVFERNSGGPGAWGQVEKITASDAEASDFFGTSVSISGDTVIVGAPGDDDNGDSSGAAYFFRRDQDGATSWTEIAKVTSSEGTWYDHFGDDVSISGDTAAIGAQDTYNNGVDSGSVYVFHRENGGTGEWEEVAEILASDGTYSDAFGASVVIQGDTVLVGAIGDDDHGPFSGSAYLFRRLQNGTGDWEELLKITPHDGFDRDYFGNAVAIENGIVVVGAYLDDGLGTDSGSAYIFTINEPVFFDTFETGDTSAWSAVVP